MKQMKELSGRIILFQEERIRLVDERGRSFLLDVSHGVPFRSEDISGWIRSGTRLAVSYEGDPETETGVVHAIKKAA